MSSSWQYSPPTSYTYAGPYVRSGRVTTSTTEITQILIAAAVLTLDITIISRGFFLPASIFNTSLLASVAFAATAALTAFVFHELAHKVAAQHRGYWAEFRMSPLGLFLSVITSLFGFLFAVPGATVVQGMGDKRDWGWTSLAGPTTNLVEGAGFFAAALLYFHYGTQPVVFNDLLLLAFFNGWFATFNLIPLGPLDGRKVLNWNLGIWIASFLAAAVLAGYMFALLFGYVSL